MKYFCFFVVVLRLYINIKTIISLNKKYQIIRLLALILIWTGCTNKKDGFSYRVFHNTTAKYNGYFYAQESMKEARKILDKEYKEDYDKILPVFVYGDEKTAQSIYPQMERVIDKTQLVIKRHNMEVKGRAKKKSKRPELNKWIDNNYLLLGQGYFYKKDYFKAGEFLKYVSRKYKDPEVLASANNWLAKIQLESKDWNQVIVSLKKAETGEIDDEIKAETEQIYADYYIRKKDYRKASDHLTKAISLIKRKKDKARPTFILAQLNEKMGESQRAIDLYEEVVGLKPKYELEFYALINQAMAFNSRGGNATEIKEKLNKMLRDDKNIEYRDQIYYALADLSFAERNIEGGIDYLHQSLDSYVDNDKQKGKTFVRLADMYFEEKKYEPAQKYYDSTMTKINDENDRFLEIKTRAETLTELIVNLNTISSLSDDIVICEADDEKKNELLKNRQKRIQAEMDEKLRLAQEALDAANEAAAASGSTGSFWAYNPILKTKGKEYFLDVWGNRPLEDNWRRKYKTQSFNTTEENEVKGENQEVVKGDFYVPTIEELKADLPCDPSDLSIAKEAIAKAYYDNGLIYKEKYDDFEPGIESWENLVDKLDQSTYHEMTYYQLYRSYYNKEQNGYTSFGCVTCKSKHWADIIRKKYPGSEWEKLVDNPNYLEGKDQKRQSELEAYRALYIQYSSGNYVSVIQGCREIIEDEPDNYYLCRHKLLRAQAIGHMDGQSGQRENYIQALREITISCKDLEEGDIAKSILAKLDGNVDDPKEEVKKEDLKPKPEMEDSPFTEDPMIRHYFAIIVPLKTEPKIDFNNLKSKVTDYLKVYHKTEGRKVTSNLFGREYQILLVKTFKSADEALQFKGIFQANMEELKDLNSSNYEMFIVSKNNYLTIFKQRNLQDYIDWQKLIYN